MKGPELVNMYIGESERQVLENRSADCAIIISQDGVEAGRFVSDVASHSIIKFDIIVG